MRILKRCSAISLALLLAPVTVSAESGDAPPQHEGGADFKVIGKCKGFLEGVLPDGHGGLWMLDVEGGRIVHAESGKDCVEKARLDGYPAGAKFAPDGTMTIVGRGGMHSFDTQSGAIKRISVVYEGEELLGLNDLAYDPRGGIYFTAPGSSDTLHPNGRVFYRSSEGEVTLVASGLAYPNGIAVDPAGNNIMIAEFGKNQLLAMPTLHSTHRLKFTYIVDRMTGGFGPDGITYTQDGRVLIANFGGGTLEIYEPLYGITKYRLPAGGGTWTTNVALIDGTVVIVDAEKGNIWQTPLPKARAGQ